MTQPWPTDDERPVLLLGPNPTPNGGMHLGHIAGPYLTGDVYARYQRARGRQVVFTTGTDDSQTYMVASARRLGTTPAELARTATAEIEQALCAIGISFDGFGPFDEQYRHTVQEFYRELYRRGAFRLRTVRLPYLERTGEYLVEGMIEGDCPNCLTLSRGGLCETCCHPNNYDELVGAYSTVDARDVPGIRAATIMVFPLEEYRDRLTAYHEKWAPYWRPHMVAMVREILSRPLPEIPITYPLDWGLPAPFPEVPGQVLNAWLELIPAGMFTTAYAARRLGRDTEPGELWRSTANMRLVHVLGFDNSFFFCLPHIALLMAYGGGTDHILPEWIVNNEFYELESDKFSTSRRHVLTPQELLREVPRDLIRLYLALTAPEYQRTTFSRAGLDKVTSGRLVGPWNQLAGVLAKAVANTADPTAPLPVSPAGRARTAAMLARLDTTYELPTYSLNRAADTILIQIDRLARRAATLDDRSVDADPQPWGDLFLETKALLAAAAPILVDLGAAARRAGGYDGVLRPGAFDVPGTVPFAPPMLPAPEYHGPGLGGSPAAGG